MSQNLTRIETMRGIEFYPRSKGAFGNLETVRHIKDLIRTAVKEDTPLEDFVVQYILAPNNLDSHSSQEKIVDRVHKFVTTKIRYVSDGAGQLEALKSARETLRRGYGDCDDLVILEASLLGVIGIASSIVLAKYNADTDGFDHVFLIAHIKGKNIPLEPTLPQLKTGQYVKRILDKKVVPVFPENWRERTENLGYVTRTVLRGAAKLAGAASPLLGFLMPEIVTAQVLKQSGDSLQGLILRRNTP